MDRKSESSAPRNVLVIRFSALGDVCMTIPVVYGVCRANRGVRFIYLTKKPVASLFIGRPDNLVVVGADLKQEYAGLRGAIRLFFKLRREYDIDAVADLHSVLRTHAVDFVARFLGLRVSTIDKMRAARQELVSRSALNAPPLKPMTERYADVFTRLGLNPPSGVESPVTGPLLPSCAADVVAPKTEGECWVAVAPFAAHRGKIYPVDKMREVVEALASRPATRVILFGGGGSEAEVLNKWAEEISGVVNLAGKRHGFEKELAIMGQCDVMLSMDSANMHLASLMGTPVVSVWGATHPAAGFGGWRQDPSLAVQAHMPCRPCSIFGDKVCHLGGYPCLHAITPAQIVLRIVDLLNEKEEKK